jgi:hypothetical protein
MNYDPWQFARSSNCTKHQLSRYNVELSSSVVVFSPTSAGLQIDLSPQNGFRVFEDFDSADGITQDYRME